MPQKLEDLLMTRTPFKEGYRSKTSQELDENKRLAEAQKALWDLSPTYRIVEPEIGKVTTSEWPSKLVGKIANLISGSKGESSPSFAVYNKIPGLKGWINLSKDQITPEVLAHEAGHIKQGMVGERIKNNDSAETILEEALQNRFARDARQPEPIKMPNDYWTTLVNATNDGELVAHNAPKLSIKK